MPSTESVEEYLRSVEEYFYSSLSTVTHSLPDVHEAVNRLWLDISRYGPGFSFPEVSIPSLGDFQVPPPPPPPPPPIHVSLLGKSTHWVSQNPWKASGIIVGVLGAGLLVGYRDSLSRRRHLYKARKVHTTDRLQVIVVLGGDSHYALPVILELEKKGYIVIASVATAEAVEILEAQTNGYVKALVLDPFEPATVPVFLRSLSAAMSRKFPLHAPGDPYVSPTNIPYIHSLLSFLSLSAPVPSIHAPLEHVSLLNTYLPYLTATQITPLQVIQSLLPLLRSGSPRTKDKGKKSIIVCLPATDARVGLPFASVQAMSAAATLRGIEILRREVGIATLSDKSESMNNIKIVVVDVGSFDVPTPAKTVLSEGVYKSMEDWTASEKVIYGPAFVSVMHDSPVPATVSRWRSFTSAFKRGAQHSAPRKPTDLSVLVDNLIGVISNGKYGSSIWGLGLGMGRIRNWIRGQHFAVGAGASTYRVASYLPSSLLDVLLNLPHVLAAIHRRLLPVSPVQLPPPNLPPTVTAADPPADISIQDEAASDHSHETGSNTDADIENNASDTVDSSWVSLNSRRE